MTNIVYLSTRSSWSCLNAFNPYLVKTSPSESSIEWQRSVDLKLSRKSEEKKFKRSIMNDVIFMNMYPGHFVFYHRSMWTVRNDHSENLYGLEKCNTRIYWSIDIRLSTCLRCVNVRTIHRTQFCVDWIQNMYFGWLLFTCKYNRYQKSRISSNIIWSYLAIQKYNICMKKIDFSDDRT